MGLPFALVCFGHGCVGGCGRVVERVVVGGSCLQGSSGWLALFGLCFLSICSSDRLRLLEEFLLRR